MLEYRKRAKREYNRRWMAADRAKKRREAGMTLGELMREKREVAAEAERLVDEPKAGPLRSEGA